MTWCRGMKESCKRLASVGPSRLPGWGLRDGATHDHTRVVGEDIYLHIPTFEDVSRHTEQQSHKDLTLQDQYPKVASTSLTDDNSLLEKFAFSDALALSGLEVRACLFFDDGCSSSPSFTSVQKDCPDIPIEDSHFDIG
ncbi:unnamed protein product [Schistosoma mattheei]|uniref:Uncharacterized protein n=1 Tax=Schistosoma mattheei TaxID=31246 RepID=A0A183PJ50_9TREM|nr:unnamed protein product [Schistosoma mattheei]